MYKPDDNNIDRAGRDAAEHYHAPGKPDWSALQQILDKELPQEEKKKRRGFFFFFLLAGLFLAGSGIWYGIHINNKNETTALVTASGSKDKSSTGNTASQSSTAQPTVAGKTSAENSTSGNGSPDQPAPAVKNSSASTANSVTASANPQKNIPGNATSLTLSEQRATVSHSGSKTVMRLSEKSGNPLKNIYRTVTNSSVQRTVKAGNPLQDNTQVKNNTAAVADELVSSDGQEIITRSRPQKNMGKKGNEYATAAITKGRNKPAGKKTSVQQTNTPVSAGAFTTDVAANTSVAGNVQKDAGINSPDKPLSAALIDAVTDTIVAAKDSIPEKSSPATVKNDTAVTVKKKATSKNNKAILIALTAGLDISTIKLTYGDNAGYNIGLMGGYQFSRHWSVYTGLIYTKKNYKLDGVDFHPPKHYWTQYVNLQTVEGYCRMWEVPLLARYTFNPSSKTPFFVSTGLSSYFMKQQEYNYSYKNSMNQPMTGSWGTDSSFNHAFSIIHLSGGLEKRIGKRMNLQVEPYAKIPLGGLGFGNIRLSSFGINFSVQYRQPVKR